MPPRKKKLTAGPVDVDLTGSSPEPAPKPKRAQKAVVDLVQDEEDADLAMGRALQEEENAGAREKGMQDEVVVMEIPIASGSNSRLRRTSSRTQLAASTSTTAPLPPLSQLMVDKKDSTDPKMLLSEHRKLFVGGNKCYCGAKLARDVRQASLEDESYEAAFLALGSTQCASCEKTICRGCGEESSQACCSAGRAVILYEVLAALDKVYVVERLHKPAPSSAVKPKAKKARGKIKGNGAGTGYGSESSHYAGGGGPLAALGGLQPGTPAWAAMMYGMGGGDEDEFYSDEDDEDIYGMPYGYHPPPQVAAAVTPPEPKINVKDAEQDLVYLAALRLISLLLPHPDLPDAQIYDYLPHPSLAPLLVVSTLADLLTDLLRNDSVSEWTARSEVYFALLDILTTLSGSEATLGVLFGERREKKWSEGIGSWMTGEGDVVWDRKVPLKSSPKMKKAGKKRKAESSDDEDAGEVIMAAPLFSFLRRLITQSEAFRKAATTGEFTAADSRLIGLCGDISAAGDRCKGTVKIWNEQRERDGIESVKSEPAKVAPSNGKGKGRAIEEPVYGTDDYAAACRALAYDSVDLSSEVPGGGKTFLTHYYNKELVATAAAKRPHGGFVGLAKELAVLSTSLPPGIWLRVDEARIDAIKCLIAGPSGTPYAGGLFEFDIFIPLAYPNTPPLVWLKTTGGNAVRFNPNLYAEGKVCLSILGTWPGSPDEMWKSSSTLLQVLISIQAMILGSSFPYYNEPGYGAPKDGKQNKDYNSNVSLATVRHAIIHWMQPTMQSSIWADVIATHLTFNRSTITEQVAAWAAKDARMKRWTLSMNVLSGSTMLAVDHRAAQAQIAAMEQFTGVARRGVPAAPGSAVERNLVEELEAGFGEISLWRTPGFYSELLE